MHKYSQLLTLHRPRLKACGVGPWLALCLAVLVFVAAPRHAGAAPATEAQVLGWDLPLQRLDDPAGRLTPQEVLADTATAAAPAAGAWQPLHQPLNAGYLRQVVWLKFVVPPAATPGDPAWLLALPTYLDSVRVYQRDAATGAWTAQHSGDYVPARDKAPVRQHLFRLVPGEVALVRLHTSSAVQFRGTVFASTEALGAALAAEEGVLGLYFGAMVALLLGIWAATAVFRTRSLFSLAALVTASVLHVLNVRGYLNLVVPAAWTAWASHAVGIGAFGIAAVLAWQIREQLTRGTPYRAAHRVLTGLAVLNLLGTVSAPLGFYPDVAWLNLLSLVVGDVIAVALCLKAIHLRERAVPHALLLCAYGSHLLGGVPTSAVMTGLVQLRVDVSSLWQFQALVFTALIASAIFIGMVQRYRQAQQSKDRAIALLAESEHVLEDRIEQRTQELFEAQQSLKMALESERELREEQRQFFHMISHEFRTPLAVLDSAAAQQQAFPTPDLQAQIDRAHQIRRACRRLTSLVDSCLISERLDSVGFTLQAAPVNVAALLEHAAQLVHWSPRHRLHLFTESAPVEWVCDQALVRIALSNLVDNAVKYAREGEIFIAAKKNDAHMLEISVADEGSGMSLEVMGRIFAQFERGDRTDQTRGFGLGLWVARRVARLHGGDITVESQLDQGACFTLTLAPQRMLRADS